MALDKVIDSAQLDAGMKATADAIREKTGSTGPIVWDSANGFKTAVEGIQAGGGDDGSLKAVIERTATNPTLPADLKKVGEYAFYRNEKLTAINIPVAVSYIGRYAFAECTELASISLPNGTWLRIYDYAFQKCVKLTSPIQLPTNLYDLKDCSFWGCTGLTEVTFNSTPANVGSSVFIGCTNLLTINVPWAEGEVSGAPWGATNATINYNYTGG